MKSIILFIPVMTKGSTDETLLSFSSTAVKSFSARSTLSRMDSTRPEISSKMLSVRLMVEVTTKRSQHKKQVNAAIDTANTRLRIS
jgi:hypothetical protein